MEEKKLRSGIFREKIIERVSSPEKLNDPAKGAYSVPMDVFDRSFTGVCLMIEPGEGFAPGGKPKSVLSFARKRLQGAEAAILFVTLTTVITSLTGILSAGFSRVFLDQLLTGRDPEWVTPFFIGLGLLTAIQLVSAWVQAIYSLRLNGKMAVVGNASYMWKVLKLPMEFFSQRMAGDIQQRKGANASIAGSVVDTVAPLFLNTVMVVFYFVVMIRYSWLLTLVGLSTVLINVWLSRVISRQRVNITRVQMRDAGKLAAATVSGVEMIETIKASGAENGFFEKWSGYQASVNTQSVRFARVNQYLGMIPAILSSLSSTAVLILGVWLTMRGAFTTGMILAFQGFMSSFLAPAGQLISASQTVQEMRTSMERIEDVMEYPDDPMLASESDEDADCDKLSGTLSMRGVTFGYSRLAPSLIEDFNLELKQGRRVAFVGASGCGKSTLMRVMLGFETPQKGAVYYDGRDLKKLDLKSLRRHVGAVMQNGKVFTDDIFSNITISAPWLTLSDAWEAAEIAGMTDDIRDMPMGMNTLISDGQGGISGGQRQRLLIARAVAPKPKVLMFDEATSALDNLTQKQVSEALDKMKCTRIVIAHRLSTIRRCDRIIVLDKGKIVEDGSYDELIAQNGAFAELAARQRLDDTAYVGMTTAF